MPSSARLRDPSGRVHVLHPGDLIGRTHGAACRLADPRVSEAHALLTLRGRELRLLVLRGELWLDGRPDDDFALAAGQRVGLAPGVELLVEAVELPEDVLALQVGEEAPRELCAAVYTLLGDDLVAGYRPGGLAYLWSNSDGWTFHLPDRPPQPVRPGSAWLVGGVSVCARLVRVDEVEAAATLAVSAPLTVVARHENVHIERRGREVVCIDGLLGRLVSEVAIAGVPVPWLVVARELWPGEGDATVLRTLWDRTTRRLRQRLREAGVREDLVRPDGRGNVELLLRPGDRVRDEA